MIAKWYQIRMVDRVMVWQFYEDEKASEAFGSRGITLTDDEVEQLRKLSFGELVDAKIKGVAIVDSPTTLLETLAKRAYDEYVKAKQEEEASKQQIVE